MGILGNLFGNLMGAEKNLPAGAVLIDVRSPGEYASGFIEGAISLPLDRLGQSVQLKVPDKNAAIIVYCLSGARSASAKNGLLKLGYVNVSNGGGIGSLALKLNKSIVTTVS